MVTIDRMHLSYNYQTNLKVSQWEIPAGFFYQQNKFKGMATVSMDSS